MFSKFSFRSAIVTMKAGSRSAAAPLVSAGRFNVRSNMREAVKLARSINRSFGCCQYRMVVALRTVWNRAKAAMGEACAAEPFATREPVKSFGVKDIRRPAFVRRSTAFVSGSRLSLARLVAAASPRVA